MSIRTKILIPMAAILLLTIALVGFIGLRSVSASQQLAAFADKTIQANEASRSAREKFEQGDALLARVLAMTDFIEPEMIKSQFGRFSGEMDLNLGRLKAASLSDRMSAVAGEAQAAAGQWREDAEILLGIRRAREIPTTELIGRHSIRLRDRLAEAVGVAGREARAGIAATHAETTWEIWMSLGLGGALTLAAGVSLFFIATSLSKPLVRLAAAADRLASGDVSVQIGAGDRRDEIGSMAAAVQVFKDNLIRSRVLEEEAVLARAGIEAQRQAAMRGLADGFEAAVGGIVETVSASAQQLQ